VFTHTAGASTRYLDGSEAAARLYASGTPAELYGAGDAYNGLTCDLRMAHLWRHNGIASGRYLAQLTIDRHELVGAAGTRIACQLTVKNLSSLEWRDDGSGRFRIVQLLRSTTGRVLQELPIIPLSPPTIPPGGTGTVLLDFTLPDTPGHYELFLDVIEVGVCWFSSRSSPPLVCPIQAFAKPPKIWNYQALVEKTYAELLGREPDPEGLTYWVRVLRDGAPLEWFLSGVCGASGIASQSKGARLERRLARLRRALLTNVDATLAR
jgi:hypothetical protein